MKTTVDLPDGLLIRAKKRAAEERRSLRALLADSLTAYLDRRPRLPGGGRSAIPWDRITVEGGLPEDVDLSNREAMADWLRRDPE